MKLLSNLSRHTKENLEKGWEKIGPRYSWTHVTSYLEEIGIQQKTK
jgi:hypothetical protein